MLSKRRIAIVGSSGHARVVLDVLCNQGGFEVVGFIDSFVAPGTEIFGLPILGTKAVVPDLFQQGQISGLIVAIGDNHTRGLLTQQFQETVPDIEIVSAVHPAAVRGEGVHIGPGSVLMAGAIVNPGTTIGQGCIVNSRASLDHDSCLGDFASLAPGVTTGGNVRIGEYAAVGIGATIFHGLEIGEQTVIGGGSVVTRSIPPFSVAYGVPAKFVRSRQAGDKYL